jgi:hypothetical protein
MLIQNAIVFFFEIGISRIERAVAPVMGPPGQAREDDLRGDCP